MYVCCFHFDLQNSQTNFLLFLKPLFLLFRGKMNSITPYYFDEFNKFDSTISVPEITGKFSCKDLLSSGANPVFILGDWPNVAKICNFTSLEV